MREPSLYCAASAPQKTSGPHSSNVVRKQHSACAWVNVSVVNPYAVCMCWCVCRLLSLLPIPNKWCVFSAQAGPKAVVGVRARPCASRCPWDWPIRAPPQGRPQSLTQKDKKGVCWLQLLTQSTTLTAIEHNHFFCFEIVLLAKKPCCSLQRFMPAHDACSAMGPFVSDVLCYKF